MLAMLAKADPRFKRFRCVTPMWDNTARRQSGAHIYVGSTPKLYGAWLAEIATQTVENFSLEERFIFINAWNEWAEGCHLEPDLNWGRQYLEATKAALDSVNNAVIPADDESPMPRRSYSKAKGVYWQTLAFLAEQRDLLNNLLGRQG